MEEKWASEVHAPIFTARSVAVTRAPLSEHEAEFTAYHIVYFLDNDRGAEVTWSNPNECQDYVDRLQKAAGWCRCLYDCARSSTFRKLAIPEF